MRVTREHLLGNSRALAIRTHSLDKLRLSGTVILTSLTLVLFCYLVVVGEDFQLLLSKTLEFHFISNESTKSTLSLVEASAIPAFQQAIVW